MAFWKKENVDPWDIDPEKRKKEREKEKEKAARRQEREQTPGLLDELKEWNENRKAKRAAEENMPPEKCPWCGKDMKRAYLTGGDGRLTVSEKRPHPLLGVEMDGGWAYLINDGGAINRYKLAWFCPDCRKLVVDVPEEDGGPNYTWENGEIKRKEEPDAYEQYREQVKKYQ